MKNLEASSCVRSEPKCDEDTNEIAGCQGRYENYIEYNNILTCSSQLVKSFNILKNPLNGASSRNPYYKKVLFGEKSQMNHCNGTQHSKEFDSVSVARKGSLDDIKDDKQHLNNYKTWPERFDKTKESICDTKSQQESVNIHINNGFDLEASESKDDTCQNDKTPVNIPKNKNNNTRGCLDMSNNGGCAQGTMRLNQALDNISLAYNPITKQLHFVTPKNATKPCLVSQSSECDSKKGSFSDEGNYSLSNGDKSDSLSSESPRSTLIRSGHQRGADGGSFSSTVSSLSECSLSGSCVSDPCVNQESQEFNSKSDCVKVKKKGLSGFFSR